MLLQPFSIHSMLRPDQYPNIIFDLGGVILNIDYQRTIEAFHALGISDFATTYTQLHQSELFDAFERGEVSEDVFRASLRKKLPQHTSDMDIDAAWNAMLLNLPVERLWLLGSLHRQRRLFLLSNTNSIHVRAFETRIAQDHGPAGLAPFFEKTYYSCDMGMRKPEERIFLAVTAAHGLEPSQTLFIDDSPQHVEGARRAGLAAYHLTGGETILNLFGHLS
jgi:glucose-1-phosphatase